MPTFAYKALDVSGTLTQGQIDAATKIEAHRKLSAQSFRPVEIALSDRVEGEPIAVNAPPRLRGPQLLQFTEELADLLDAGLQLEPALRVIEQREEKSALRPVAAFLRQQVREGKPFSAALRACRGSFSDLYVNMVAAGEAAGALENILRKQAQYAATVLDLQKRVTMALVYPGIVFSAAIVLICIFMVVLLPQLTSLLTKTGRELPMVTKFLIGMSAFLSHYWLAILLGIGLVFLGHRLWVSQPAGRMAWDKLTLQLPLIGPVLQQRFLAQFLQTLATLLSNGVTLLTALTLVRNATGNTYIRTILDRVSEQVGEGLSLTRCLKKSKFFPSVLIDIVGVGEQTGKIALALQRGAVRYDKEFNAHVQRLTLLIQPAVILMVALFVGLIAYSMITGILTTVSGLRMR